jgi:hypothetical protein
LEKGETSLNAHGEMPFHSLLHHNYGNSTNVTKPIPPLYRTRIGPTQLIEHTIKVTYLCTCTGMPAR